MAMLVYDPYVEDQLRAEREASGADRFDEVWEGIYVMTPLPNDEHQELATNLGAALRLGLGFDSPHKVYVGVNVSDRETGWQHNYRGPDVAVYLSSNEAKDCGTHWHGGPDFGIEIVSPGDRSRAKLPFYAAVNTRELLIVDRDPWRLELYRLGGTELTLVGTSTLSEGNTLSSSAIPFRFRLVAANPRPRIEVTAYGGQLPPQSWSA